jgi:tetratricopeptide (TPR) repeat protein
LALEQAAAYINAEACSFAQYLAAWSRRRDELLDSLDPLVTHYPRSVAITWLTSFQQLAEDGRRLLRIVSWLAPDPIPRSLMEVGTGPFAAESEQERTPEERDELVRQAEEALANLRRYSLATLSADKLSFSVHRLVQEVTRRNMPKDEEQAACAAALRWVSNGFVGDPQDVRNWPVLEPLAAHARAIAEEADGRLTLELTARLMNKLGGLYQFKARWSEAELLHRRALAIDEQRLGRDHPTVAIDLNDLAVLLNATNRLSEAEPLLRRALDVCEKRFGSDPSNVATALNNLAALLRATNRLAEAESLNRRALVIDEQSLGPEHPNFARDLNNLANLLGNTNRRAKIAEPLIRRALAIWEQSLGADHPNVAHALNSLAALLEATNRLSEAEPLLRRALEIDEKSYGPEHPEVARDLSNLAELLQSKNRLAEAEPLMRRALAIDEKSYGSDHPKVAKCLYKLGRLLQETSRLDEAAPLYRHALTILEKHRTENGVHHELEKSVRMQLKRIDRGKKLALPKLIFSLLFALLLIGGLSWFVWRVLAAHLSYAK